MRSLFRATLAVASLLVIRESASPDAAHATGTQMSLGCGYCASYCDTFNYGLAYCRSIGCGIPDGHSCESEHPGCGLNQQYNRCTGNEEH